MRSSSAGLRLHAALAVFLVIGCAASVATAAGFEAARLDEFAAAMAERHGLDRTVVRRVLGQARRSESILKAIARPAERKPWYQYRPIFVTAERTAAGAAFWEKHADLLARAERDYGVPAAIIVAIIGVETYFGRIAGNYRVLDALATLGFAYPPRARFFASELEHYLLLCEAQAVNPTALTGSYAGAMGLPQFMPSSYREYAVDFDGDGMIDIWDNPADAIGSVASYLARHGWQRGGAIAHAVEGDDLARFVDDDLKPGVSMQELSAASPRVDGKAPADGLVEVVELELETGREYWLGYQNWYAITRYNHSRLYAMAVFQLAQAIAERTGVPVG